MAFDSLSSDGRYIHYVKELVGNKNDSDFNIYNLPSWKVELINKLNDDNSISAHHLYDIFLKYIVKMNVKMLSLLINLVVIFRHTVIKLERVQTFITI